MTAPNGSPRPQSANEWRAEIAATRAELADTIEQLAARLDVKADARRQLSRLADRIRHKVLAGKAPVILAAAAFVVIVARRRRADRRAARTAAQS